MGGAPVNIEIWLWMLLVMLPHNERTMKIVEKYGGVRSAAEAMRDGKCEELTEDERLRAVGIRSREVNALINDCATNGIQILTIEDEDYPDILRNIYNPPIVLFVQGTLEGFNAETALAVVGSRDCSRYALDMTKDICGELCKVGMSIISGLAVGVDTTAHQSALDHGAKTIGVLACGNLVDYPTASRTLKANIIRSGGAVISELPPHTKTDPDYFKHRNRIISGLAMGTFIVEARRNSGCRFTAEHAIQQGRELFCMPPYNVKLDECAGVIPFLRDGATPVFGHVDIINAYKYSLFNNMRDEL